MSLNGQEEHDAKAEAKRRKEEERLKRLARGTVERSASLYHGRRDVKTEKT